MTISTTKQMSTQDCTARFPFVCLKENLVLVKENKTWEEALEHCRALNYELISLQPGEDHQKVMGYVMDSETNKVSSPSYEPGPGQGFSLLKCSCSKMHSGFL